MRLDHHKAHYFMIMMKKLYLQYQENLINNWKGKDMKDKKSIKTKYVKYYLIFTIFIALFTFTNLYSDISSISPTINDHIHTNQWQNSGYPNGGISANNPSAIHTETILASDNIQQKIDDLSGQYPGELTKIQLPAGAIYQLSSSLTIPSNIILAGNYQYKKDKDLKDRTILEFETGNCEDNFIKFNLKNSSTLSLGSRGKH